MCICEGNHMFTAYVYATYCPAMKQNRQQNVYLLTVCVFWCPALTSHLTRTLLKKTIKDVPKKLHVYIETV